MSPSVPTVLAALPSASAVQVSGPPISDSLFCFFSLITPSVHQSLPHITMHPHLFSLVHQQRFPESKIFIIYAAPALLPVQRHPALRLPRSKPPSSPSHRHPAPLHAKCLIIVNTHCLYLHAHTHSLPFFHCCHNCIHQPPLRNTHTLSIHSPIPYSSTLHFTTQYIPSLFTYPSSFCSFYPTFRLLPATGPSHRYHYPIPPLLPIYLREAFIYLPDRLYRLCTITPIIDATKANTNTNANALDQ